MKKVPPASLPGVSLLHTRIVRGKSQAGKSVFCEIRRVEWTRRFKNAGVFPTETPGRVDADRGIHAKVDTDFVLEVGLLGDHARMSPE